MSYRKGPCEANCGRNIQVYGCRWCPACYPAESRLLDEKMDAARASIRQASEPENRIPSQQEVAQ